MAVDFGFWKYEKVNNNTRTFGSTNSNYSTNPVFEENEELDLDATGKNITEYTPEEVTKKMEEVKNWIASESSSSVTPREAIQYYLNAGWIDEEMANELIAYFTIYDERDTQSIEHEMEAKDCSRSEAIENLTNRGQIGEPITTVDDYLSSEAKAESEKLDLHITEAGINNYTEKMLTAAVCGDGGEFTKFLKDEKLTSADIVAIAKKYEGSVARGIDNLYAGPFSGGKKAKAQKQYVAALIEQAKAGNQDAIDLICKELYNSTAALNTTCDEFVEAFFDMADLELVDIINKNYSVVNQNRSLRQDICNDFSGKTRTKYTDIIDSTEYYIMN